MQDKLFECLTLKLTHFDRVESVRSRELLRENL